MAYVPRGTTGLSKSLSNDDNDCPRTRKIQRPQLIDK